MREDIRRVETNEKKMNLWTKANEMMKFAKEFIITVLIIWLCYEFKNDI